MECAPETYDRFEKSWDKLDDAFTDVLFTEPDPAEQGHVQLAQGDYSQQFEQATTPLNSPEQPTLGRWNSRGLLRVGVQMVELEDQEVQPEG